MAVYNVIVSFTEGGLRHTVCTNDAGLIQSIVSVPADTYILKLFYAFILVSLT